MLLSTFRLSLLLIFVSLDAHPTIQAEFYSPSKKSEVFGDSPPCLPLSRTAALPVSQCIPLTSVEISQNSGLSTQDGFEQMPAVLMNDKIKPAVLPCKPLSKSHDSVLLRNSANANISPIQEKKRPVSDPASPNIPESHKRKSRVSFGTLSRPVGQPLRSNCDLQFCERLSRDTQNPNAFDAFKRSKREYSPPSFMNSDINLAYQNADVEGIEGQRDDSIVAGRSLSRNSLSPRTPPSTPQPMRNVKKANIGERSLFKKSHARSRQYSSHSDSSSSDVSKNRRSSDSNADEGVNRSSLFLASSSCPSQSGASSVVPLVAIDEDETSAVDQNAAQIPEDCLNQPLGVIKEEKYIYFNDVAEEDLELYIPTILLLPPTLDLPGAESPGPSSSSPPSDHLENKDLNFNTSSSEPSGSDQPLNSIAIYKLIGKSDGYDELSTIDPYDYARAWMRALSDRFCPMYMEKKLANLVYSLPNPDLRYQFVSHDIRNYSIIMEAGFGDSGRVYRATTRIKSSRLSAFLAIHKARSQRNPLTLYYEEQGKLVPSNHAKAFELPYLAVAIKLVWLSSDEVTLTSTLPEDYFIELSNLYLVPEHENIMKFYGYLHPFLESELIERFKPFFKRGPRARGTVAFDEFGREKPVRKKSIALDAGRGEKSESSCDVVLGNSSETKDTSIGSASSPEVSMVSRHGKEEERTSLAKSASSSIPIEHSSSSNEITLTSKIKNLMPSFLRNSISIVSSVSSSNKPVAAVPPQPPAIPEAEKEIVKLWTEKKRAEKLIIPKKAGLVFESCLVDLYDFMKRRKWCGQALPSFRGLQESSQAVKFRRRFIQSSMFQLMSGLDALHGSCLIHRDIKATNIFFKLKHEDKKFNEKSNPLVLKIGDFGAAVSIANSGGKYGRNMRFSCDVSSLW